MLPLIKYATTTRRCTSGPCGRPSSPGIFLSNYPVRLTPHPRPPSRLLPLQSALRGHKVALHVGEIVRLTFSSMGYRNRT